MDPRDGFQYLSLDQNVSKYKNRNRWKNFQNCFFLTNFLRGFFKALPENTFFTKKNTFSFFYRNFGFDAEKTPKRWPRNKILWHSDEYSQKNWLCPKGMYHLQEANDLPIKEKVGHKKTFFYYWGSNNSFFLLLKNYPQRSYI